MLATTWRFPAQLAGSKTILDLETTPKGASRKPGEDSDSSTSLHPEAVSVTKRSNDTEKRCSNKYDTEDSSNTVVAACCTEKARKNAEYVGAV